jgi:asparagine synthetase B (glutamine-hydrolysing)
MLRQPSSTWFAAFSRSPFVDLPQYNCRAVTQNGTPQGVYLSTRIGTAGPSVAVRAGCSVLFDGALYNRDDVEHELGHSMTSTSSSDAETILAGYLRSGERFFERLRGSFALIVWDTKRKTLFSLRDPIGTCPLFYASAGDGFIFSTSIDLLIKHPSVSTSLNRAALSDFLIDRFPFSEETFFEAVKRVPRGHVVRMDGKGRVHSYCYWDPAPEGTVNWIKPEELEQFDELFDRAVTRCLRFGPAAIFLSGGLDSGSVAAVAAERSKSLGLPKPIALSLLFPDPAISEEVVQRNVATQLGLPFVMKHFYEAAGGNGVVEPALKMSATLPSPLLNTWWPAYYGLAGEGAKHGCRTVLTGDGGDEWLTVSPFLAADYLRSFDVAGIYKLWKSIYQSYHEPTFALFRNLIWRWGVEPLLMPPAHRVVKRLAPWAITLRHQVRGTVPKWLAPDNALRQELKERRYGRPPTKREKPDSFYLRSARTALDLPLISMVSEESFNIGERLGFRELQPFWDADLVDLLYRTPPVLLNNDGRNKGLVRSTLARRFPQVGFNQQRKMGASEFYATSLFREGGEALQRLGKMQALADLRVVDEAGLRSFLEHIVARRPVRQAFQIWKVLNLETWVRAHAS